MSAWIIVVIVVLVVAAVVFAIVTSFGDRRRGNRVEHEAERLDQPPEPRRGWRR